MKYVFQIVFGVSELSSSSKNVLLHFLFKPLRAILGFLTGSGSTGMMGSFEENKFLTSMNKGLVLDGQNKKLSEKDSFNHMGIIARTGGGKTTGYIIPNILKLAQTKSSMIVTDLSGELYQQTSGYLKKRGFKIYVLDPEDLKTSIGYNPLYYALSSIEIDEIAEILIKSANPGQTKTEDKMWLDGAKTFLTILIKVLVATKDHKCLVPKSHGVSYNFLKGVDLWEIYNTLMPRQRQELEKKYKSLKRQSQS